MRLAFPRNGSVDRLLIRLFAFSPAEGASLVAAVTALATGNAERHALHECRGVERVGDCELVFWGPRGNHAVVRVGPKAPEVGSLPASEKA